MSNLYLRKASGSSLITAVLAFVLISGCGKKITEAEVFEQAKLNEQNEEYDAAVETYLSLYKSFPTGEHGDESLFRAAIIQANILKQFDKAIETHDRLVMAFPESPYCYQSLFMKGFIYANDLKDYEMAEQSYRAFLEKYPNSELTTSVEWELKNLGRDINEIEFLSGDQADSSKAK